MRYYIRTNQNTLDAIVSPDLEEQPENSILYFENDFKRPVFDQYPNPTQVIEGLSQEEINVVQVPQVTTAMRFWISVYEILNITEDNVIEMVNKLTDLQDKVKILIMLKKAQDFDRQNEYLNAMVDAFGISQSILDKIFINAEI